MIVNSFLVLFQKVLQALARSHSEFPSLVSLAYILYQLGCNLLIGCRDFYITLISDLCMKITRLVIKVAQLNPFLKDSEMPQRKL